MMNKAGNMIKTSVTSKRLLSDYNKQQSKMSKHLKGIFFYKRDNLQGTSADSINSVAGC